MSIVRRITAVFTQLSYRMQGQDVERHNAVDNNRLGGDYAAVMSSHQRQGVTRLGFGR